MKELLFSSYFLISYGYIFYLTFGKFTLEPLKQPYNKLFEKSVFDKNLFAACLVGLIGLSLARLYDNRAALLLTPITYLVLFKVCNYLSNKINNRNIMFPAGQDISEIPITLFDRASTFFILFLSMVLPGLVMNLFR